MFRDTLEVIKEGLWTIAIISTATVGGVTAGVLVAVVAWIVGAAIAL
jgi:hypothetical protein